MKVGFCGAGVMASALANGFLSKGFCEESNVYVFDVLPESLTKIATGRNINICTSNAEVAKHVDILFLCVKPQYVLKVTSELAAYPPTRWPLVVSIAAGISFRDIEKTLPSGTRVVRVMPNTPCLVGHSASAYVGGTNATEKDLKLVHEMMSVVGLAVKVGTDEEIHAVTGLSGSGPAYIFILIEALADGGVRNGLSRPTALALATQLVKGSAIMAQETNVHPAALKDQVCSPGGTTIAGVEALEGNGFRFGVIRAVTEATKRSRELQSVSSKL